MFNRIIEMSKKGAQYVAMKGLNFCRKVEKHGKALLLAAGLGTAAAINGVVAQAEIVLPTPLGEGVGLSDYITVAITGLGGIFATVLGGFFAFRLLKMGLRYIGKIGG